MLKNHTILLKSQILIFCLFTLGRLNAQAPSDPLNHLLGRWEVVEYAEQGVQVDKKGDALAQSLAVYNHVREQRARQWYGYDADYEPDLNNRQRRDLERWAQRDSAVEVERVRQAIAMPYFAVFFPDSTLALYNKDSATNRVYFPESRHYVFSPETMSIDIYGLYYSPRPEWQAQILSLTAEEMLLFLPEDGEVVKLVKREGSFPP